MRTMLFFLLCSNICVAQAPWDIKAIADAPETIQVAFLVADAAELAENGKKVAILAENLQEPREYGVIIIGSEKTKWIEIHTAEQPFPPRVEKPYRGTRFLVRGAPGDRYYVSLRGEEPPVWVEVVVAPSATPEQPAPPVTSDLELLSRESSQKINDPQTAKELKTALTAKLGELETLCSQGGCPDIAQAKREISTLIDRIFLLRKTPSKDWLAGWRDPVSKAIAQKDPKTTMDYLVMMRAVANGL